MVKKLAILYFEDATNDEIEMLVEHLKKSLKEMPQFSFIVTNRKLETIPLEALKEIMKLLEKVG